MGKAFYPSDEYDSELDERILRKAESKAKWRWWDHRHDDDDDPPPAPVAARPPRPAPLVDAVELAPAA